MLLSRNLLNDMQACKEWGKDSQFEGNIHAVLSYKERLYKEQLVEHENHKERTLVKLGRVKEHPQLSKYAI